MNMNVSIKELDDLTKKAHNAAIEVAANLLDEMRISAAAVNELTDREDLKMKTKHQADMLLFMAERVRNLKRE